MKTMFTIAVKNNNNNNFKFASFIEAEDPRNAVIYAVAVYGENVLLYGEDYGNDSFMYLNGKVVEIDETGKEWVL